MTIHPLQVPYFIYCAAYLCKVNEEKFMKACFRALYQRVSFSNVFTLSNIQTKIPYAPNEKKKNRVMKIYYHPYSERLTNAVEEELKRNGSALIIDCHSFPSVPLLMI